MLNETVLMQCNFNLDKEQLYSVKWYKDGHEFYRYTPRDKPEVLMFPVRGVNVNVSASCKNYARERPDFPFFSSRRIILRKCILLQTIII